MKYQLNQIRKLMTKIKWLFAILMVSLPMLAVANQPVSNNKPRLQVYQDRGGDFTLKGPSGKSVGLQDFRGKVVLLNFGYTSCPDVCPIILSQLKQTMTQLKNQLDHIQVVFVTLDPQRDDLERLNEYVSYFHPSFIGLSGDPAAIKEVARQYRVRYFKETQPSVAGYFIAHTDYVYLIDQYGRYRGKYKTRWELEQLGKDIRQLLKFEAILSGKP